MTTAFVLGRAECLLRARLRSGLSQGELADRMDVSQMSVSRWEQRRAAMSDDRALLAARLLNDPRVRWGDMAPGRFVASDGTRLFSEPVDDRLLEAVS